MIVYTLKALCRAEKVKPNSIRGYISRERQPGTTFSWRGYDFYQIGITWVAVDKGSLFELAPE